jgi:hypothetical protein
MNSKTLRLAAALALAGAVLAPATTLAHAGAEPAAPAAASRAAPAGWYFSRGEAQLRVVKGDIEEIWRRESRGQVSFERIFHSDKRRVFYAPGELRTLGLDVNWDGAVELIEHSGLRERAEPGSARADVANYERFDAADLGDMDYDAFARKAEAYDVKLGWRQPHEH